MGNQNINVLQILFVMHGRKNYYCIVTLRKLYVKVVRVVLNVAIHHDVILPMPSTSESNRLNPFIEFNVLCIYRMSHVTQYLYESMSYMT